MSEDQDRRRHGPLNKIRRRIVRGRVHASGNEIAIDPDIVMAVLFFGLILLGCLVTLTLVQQKSIGDQQGQITKAQRDLRRQQLQLTFVERRDRINSYQTAFRFCSRINNDRAALHYLVGSSRMPNAAERLRRLERKGGLPILDCRPNIMGDPATYLQPRAQRVFVKRWRLGKLTPAEIGICRVKIGTLAPPGTCDG